MDARIIFSGAVEGMADEAALRRIIEHTHNEVGTVFGRSGKSDLRSHLRGYNEAAKRQPWVVLVDLDTAECAPPERSTWLPNPSSYMCLRFVVREVEAWLMGDRERLAGFLGVSQSRLPLQPESVTDPKQLLVNLVRRSRKRDIQRDMLPRPGSGIAEGPAYASRLIEFIRDRWRPEKAAQRCDSLARCIRQISDVAQAFATTRSQDA
jgi:hypothetical protein